MTRTEAIRVLQHMVRWGIISDEKMKEALKIAINSLKVDEMYQLEKEDADEFIPKRTGHWEIEDMFDGDVAYRCSACNELFCIIEGTPKDNEYNFCPNCGADMRGDTE